MCLKKDQTEGRIIFVEKTISCFTLPVPSEYTTVQAVGRKRGLQGMSLYGYRLVWELDQGLPLQEAHRCL